MNRDALAKYRSGLITLEMKMLFPLTILSALLTTLVGFGVAWLTTRDEWYWVCIGLIVIAGYVIENFRIGRLTAVFCSEAVRGVVGKPAKHFNASGFVGVMERISDSRPFEIRTRELVLAAATPLLPTMLFFFVRALANNIDAIAEGFSEPEVARRLVEVMSRVKAEPIRDAVEQRDVPTLLTGLFQHRLLVLAT